MIKKYFCLTIFILSFVIPAQAQPVLTVYTYNSFAAEWGAGPAIKKAFEKECRCILNFVSLSDSAALLNRLRMEGKQSPADIILGLDNNLMKSAEKTGLFTKHGIETSELTIPNGWKNEFFIPFDYGYFAFIYNSDKLTSPPKSFNELIENNSKLTILYQDPRTSTPGLGLLLWVQSLYKDQTTTAWQKIASQTVTVTKGWSEAYGLFLKGEADLVLSYTTSPAYHIISEKDHRYKAALFEEGHYLQVEIAGQLATSKNPELAQTFLKFILSSEFQKIIPSTNWMYPVIDIPLPEDFKEIPKPEKSLEFSSEEVLMNRSQWIQEWQAAVSR